MRLFISCDIHWESRVDLVLNRLVDLGYIEYFEARTYGNGLSGVGAIFMCRDPEYHFKRRVRHSKKEKMVYLDIMLDFEFMKNADEATRKQEMAQCLYDEVPEVLSKYKLPDFDRDAFVRDFHDWIDQTGWR